MTYGTVRFFIHALKGEVFFLKTIEFYKRIIDFLSEDTSVQFVYIFKKLAVYFSIIGNITFSDYKILDQIHGNYVAKGRISDTCNVGDSDKFPILVESATSGIPCINIRIDFIMTSV